MMPKCHSGMLLLRLILSGAFVSAAGIIDFQRKALSLRWVESDSRYICIGIFIMKQLN